MKILACSQVSDRCPLGYLFCKKPFLVNNFAKVAETLRMKINIDIIRTLGSHE